MYDPKKELEEALRYFDKIDLLVQQKRILKERYLNKLRVGKNGGLFDLNPALLQHLKLYIDNDIKEAVLLDINNNPIRIENTQEFFDELFGVQIEILNDFHVAYEKLKETKDKEDIFDV